MSAHQLTAIPGIRPSLAQAITHRDDTITRQTIQRCQQHQIQYLCPDDDAYPPQLKHCPDAPLLLFAKGDLEALAHPRMLAVVGSRKASREGHLIARRWGQYFSERQICVVSGLAYGIDTDAHAGALQGTSPTIAVLGCGLLSVEGRVAQQVDAIAKQGCVLSEQLPDQQARPEFFPKRNRIIAGMTAATLVIEASTQSGSLITAELAAGYGRDVFAVPGSVLNRMHSGCHHLIRDGAILTDTPEIILQQLHWQGGSTAKNTFTPENATEAAVYDLLQQEIMHLDAISEACGLTLPELSPILLALELQGVIERLPGSRFTLGGKYQ